MTIVVTVRSQLPEVEAIVMENVSVGVKKVAFDIEAKAKEGAPVDTGFLRSVIEAEMIGPVEATVTSYASYSLFQEFGTYKMSAQPYMVPAVEAVAAVANQAFKGLA